MANNRMYLKNTRTGARVYLAKYYPSTGWFTEPTFTIEGLNQAFDQADFGAEKPRSQYSLSGMYGVEWVLEFEETEDGVTP